MILQIRYSIKERSGLCEVRCPAQSCSAERFFCLGEKSPEQQGIKE